MEKQKHRILEAAEKEFVEKGFAGARTTAIAQSAGLSHTMLHYYFKTKEQLFDEVLLSKISFFQQSVLSAFDVSDMPIEECIIEGARRHFEFLVANPSLPRFVLFALPKQNMRQLIHLIVQIAKRKFPSVQQRLDEAHARGEINKVDFPMLCVTIVSLNMLPFLANDVLSCVSEVVDGFEPSAFVERRKQENIQIIRNILTKPQ
jgi:AcrR family transcriptional regulator